MFVAMLSSTVVSNALPTIVADLHGSQTEYTWVVVATLLTMTATTPIWGKLADLFNKKLLVQTALVIFVIGSLIAGTRASMTSLIGARAVQGLGVGGLTALVQVVIAAMVTAARARPLLRLHRRRLRRRHRQRPAHRRPDRRHPRAGLALVLLRRRPGRAWSRFVLLQKTLHLPVDHAARSSIDYLGATLLIGGVCTLLIWVSLAGNEFAWASTVSWRSSLGGRRCWSPRRRTSSCGSPRADRPAAPVPRPDHGARHRSPA